MAAINPTFQVHQVRSPWLIALLWFAAGLAGFLAYALPVGLVYFVFGLDRLDDPRRAAELTTAVRLLAAVLSGAGYGLSFGLAGWLVLRTQFQRIGAWVVATVAAYAALPLIALGVSAFRPAWLDWAITLIVNGKAHWLAGVAADWPAADWAAGALTLGLFGLLLGFAQWLVLRRYVARASWWIAANAVGWVASGACAFLSWSDYVFAAWAVPLLLAAIAMAWLRPRALPSAARPAGQRS